MQNDQIKRSTERSASGVYLPLGPVLAALWRRLQRSGLWPYLRPVLESLQRHLERTGLLVYLRPAVVGMLFLGFSAGLPFMLVFGTLTARLKEAGVSEAIIGYFAWVGITYSIKVAWSPIVDRVPFPLLTRFLGKRRGWMLAGQLGIAAGLLGMSINDPATDLGLVAAFAVLVAFSSATQDVAVDAYRIEAEEQEYQGAMAATYTLGYRIAILVSYTGALYIAEALSWSIAYMIMAVLTSVGIMTVFVNREPFHHREEDRALRDRAANSVARTWPHLGSRWQGGMAWLVAGVYYPLRDFFVRYRWMGLAILGLVACFRISDLAMSGMANPFYLEVGFSKQDMANISGAYGLGMTIIGAIVGGSVVARLGFMRPLLVSALLVGATNLLFSYLATQGADLVALTMVISADNLSGGFASAVFIAWMSSLTNQTYTATQFALFSSLMTLPGKMISGWSGHVVEAVGFEMFFVYTAALGIPAVLLVLFIMQRGYTSQDESVAPPAEAGRQDA